MTGPQQLVGLSLTINHVQLHFAKLSMRGYLVDIAIPNRQNLYSTTTTKKLQKHTDLKEVVTSTLQLNADYIVILVYSTTDFIPQNQEKQFTYNVILRHVSVTIDAVEIQ
jgi:hypothetical protein